MKFLRKGVSLFFVGILLFSCVLPGAAETNSTYSEPTIPIDEILGTEQLDDMLSQAQYHIGFYDQAGSVELYGVDGLTADDIIPAYGGAEEKLLITDKALWGWSALPQALAHYTDIAAVDLNQTAVGSLAVADSDTINLYPWYADVVNVQFDSGGGTPVPVQTIIDGQLAVKPLEPTRQGYTFVGWMVDGEDGLALFDFINTPLRADLTLYASWTAEQTKFTVAYMYQNDDGYEQLSSEEAFAPTGSYIALDQLALIYTATLGGAKAGDVYTAATGESPAVIDTAQEGYTCRYVQPSEPIMADGSTIIDLYFDRNTYNLTLATGGAEYDGQLDELSMPYLHGEKIYDDDADLINQVESGMHLAGYAFAGWYMDAECTDDMVYPLNEFTTMTGDLTLHAKWVPIEYTAKFYLYQGDSEPLAVQPFTMNDKLTDHALELEPPLFVEDFLCWCWQEAATDQLIPFDFDQPLAASFPNESGELHLYAAWKSTYASISYHIGSMGDAEDVNDHKYDNNSYIELREPSAVWPAIDPTTFAAWQVDGELYAPGTRLSVDGSAIDATALWQSDFVKLSYHVNYDDLDTAHEVSVQKNADSALLGSVEACDPAFTREGYMLLGWATASDDKLPAYALGEALAVLDENIDLYAVWGTTVTVENLVQTSMNDPENIDHSFLFAASITNDGDVYELKPGDGYTVAEDGTIAFALEHSQSVALEGIPVGSQLTIQEEPIPDGFSVTYQAQEGELEEGDEYVATVSAVSAVTFLNTLATDVPITPDTGVLLDSLPYLLILCFVLIGIILFIRGRHRRGGDD